MHKFPKAGLVFYRVLYSLVLLILVIVVVKAAGDRIGVLGVLLLFALSYLVSVLIHESGHILAALVSGWRILIIALGFLLFSRQGRNFRLRYLPRFIFGGFTYAVPLRDRNLERQFFWGILAGPLFSIAFSALCAALISFTPLRDVSASTSAASTPDVILWSGCLSCCILSLLISINSLLPGEDFIGASDGRKLLQILAKSEESRALLAIVSLEGASESGVRPRDWSEEQLRLLQTPGFSVGLRIHGLLLQYFVDLDRNEELKAGSSLDLALILAQGASFPGLALYHEAAFFTAQIRNQPELARKWLALIRPGFIDFSLAYARAQAAINLAEGNYAQAMTWVVDGFQYLEGTLDTGKTLAERDWLKRIESQIHEKIAKPSDLC